MIIYRGDIMKHAIMIIAHKNVEQVCHLVKILKNDSLDIFIHLDKKWNISEDEIRKIKKSNNQVYICTKRISGFLDTWSLCEITIELMKCAREKGPYAYYFLLSGQDYPIKPISEIVKKMDESYPKPIIDCTPMRKDNWIYSGFKWRRFLVCYRFIENLTDNYLLRKILLFPVYGIQFGATKLFGSPYKKLQKEKCMLYGGSAWWCLPDAIVNDCINEVKKNTNIVKAFKIKTTPEETFFQTMAMRSELSNMIELNDPYAVLQNCDTYAYFFDDNHEPTGHPYVLQSENFDMLKSRKELFARKFDFTVDTDIIQKIDENILGRNQL